ncbi:putative serine/threonine protein kinase [Gordonia effusa NBRC 100432]|uniref:non-specific serine/threonine protein kinase n=1 Tax=Gordonia effusa NBRC 100432 TaxID=1077974 RepID=H0R5R0_9ACTN|nr:serine/threonine-protein kinase [Gordonia effusa]GAB20411.1 putative serine/threonine protein kinase [Gordonia effusa NBRC 100432]
MSESRVGTQFGPYRLDELLGRGGMGEVYRAYDTEKGRVVALKLLNPSLANDQVYQERFRRESRMVARLGEPHIIPIHDFGDLEGVLYLDMRLVSGRDLRKVLTDAGKLTPERAVAIVGQIAQALDAAHADGLVHRDVKPENILVTESDFAYLVDFGIAQSDSSTHLTQAGSTIGSFAYMAPEQFDNETASSASDIYALAAVFFECLTGQVPHPAATVSKAIKAAVLDPTPTLRSLDSHLPAALEPVIARALAKAPEQRYPSAAEFATEAHAAIDIDSAEASTSEHTISLLKPDHSPVPSAGATTEVIESAAPGAYDETQYRVPAYSPTVIRPSGPVQLGPGNVSAPQPGSVSQPHAGYLSQPQPAYVPQPVSVPSAYVTGPPYPPPPQQRSLIPILAGIAVVLLILLGAAIFIVATSQGDSTPVSDDSIVTQTVTSTQDAPSATVPAPESTQCDTTVGVGTSVTSCAFAFAVRDEYLRTGAKGQSRQVIAYSPKTFQSYVMNCNPEGDVVACRGGNNAVVVIY